MDIPGRKIGNERIAGWRLTEVPSLYGLVVRERGELIEYVSFAEARSRLDASAKKQERLKHDSTKNCEA